MCVALCGGGVSTGSGVSGEGAACRDGGMSDGGEDGVEERSGRAAGEHQTCSDAERKTTRSTQHTHAAHAGRRSSGGERCAEPANDLICIKCKKSEKDLSYKSMYKRKFSNSFPECIANNAM